METFVTITDVRRKVIAGGITIRKALLSMKMADADRDICIHADKDYKVLWEISTFKTLVLQDPDGAFTQIELLRN